MEADANDYEWQAKQAEANYADLKVRLQSQTFEEQSLVATAQGDLKQATDHEGDGRASSSKSQLESQLNAKLAVAKWEQAASRFQMEKQKLDIMKQSVDAQLEAQQVQIEKLRATWVLKKKQVDELTIRAGIKGRMQEMTSAGGAARQAWRRAGQGGAAVEADGAPADRRDAGKGRAARPEGVHRHAQWHRAGHVTRIDASIVNGTRTVDCKLDGALPAGAVPDLSVDGTIEWSASPDVVYMARPVFGQPNSQVSLFTPRTRRQGSRARCRAVWAARRSNAVEILGGLKPGDQVDPFRDVRTGPESAHSIELTGTYCNDRTRHSPHSHGSSEEGLRHR